MWQRPIAGGQTVAMLDRVTLARLDTFWWRVSQLSTLPAVYEGSTGWVVALPHFVWASTVAAPSQRCRAPKLSVLRAVVSARAYPFGSPST